MILIRNSYNPECIIQIAKAKSNLPFIILCNYLFYSINKALYIQISGSKILIYNS